MGKKIGIAVGLLVVLLCLAPCFVFLQGLTDAAKEDPDPAAQAHAMEKDTINGYGLKGNQTLSQVKVGEVGDVVCYEDRLVRRFSYKKQNLSQFAAVVKNLRARYPQIKDVYVMPLPERVVMEPEFAADEEKYEKCVQQLTKAVGKQAEIVDPWPTLAEHTDEYIFYRTESGWTARGAYYGSVCLCEAMGIEPISLRHYEEHMYGTFKGALYSTVKSLYEVANGREKADEVIDMADYPFYYILPKSRNIEEVFDEKGNRSVCPVLSISREGTSAFVEGNNFQYAILPGNKMSNEMKKETVLILCDRHGKILAPYLADYCSRLYVVNIEQYSALDKKLPELLKKYGITKIVIARSASEIGDESVSAATNFLSK